MEPKKGFLNWNVADFDIRQKSCHVLEQQYCCLAFFQVVEVIVYCHQKLFFVHNCVQVEYPDVPIKVTTVFVIVIVKYY